MKKIIILFAIALSAIFACGCSSIIKSVKDKSINLETTVYGLEVISSDVTANGSPTGKLGFGSIRYRSIPMDQGQPFYISEEINSIFGNATKTTIWLGRAATPSVLSYEAVPSTMIKIEGTAINTCGSTVTVTDCDTGTEKTIKPVVVSESTSE